MNKRALRPCPICENVEAGLLHTQKFILPEGHPLSAGYDVVCCRECGFVYADTSVTQEQYDLLFKAPNWRDFWKRSFAVPTTGDLDAMIDELAREHEQEQASEQQT